MAIKNTVYDNLIAQLETVIEGGTYVTTIREAYRVLRGHTRGREQTPAIAIVENNETLLVEDATNKRYLLSISLFIEMTGWKTDIEKTLTNCERDIKLLFDSPINLGTNVLYSRLVSVISPVASEQQQAAGSQIDIEITYYESKT